MVLHKTTSTRKSYFCQEEKSARSPLHVLPVSQGHGEDTRGSSSRSSVHTAHHSTHSSPCRALCYTSVQLYVLSCTSCTSCVSHRSWSLEGNYVSCLGMRRDQSVQTMSSPAEVLHLSLTQKEVTLKVFSNSQHKAQNLEK